MDKINSWQTTKKPLLQVENFSVGFRMYDHGLNQMNQQAVHDISMEVYPGEIVAVVGSSGSGKSLLAHGVLGILPRNASVGGKIIFKGEILTDKTIAKKRGREIALVPQSVSYLDPLMKTGRQVFGKEETPVHRQMLEQFGFSAEDGKKYPFQLSGGMARRVLVMTSAISQAELIIADEPTPGLNPKLAHEILASFRKMADQGKGVLLITHDIDLVCEVADRIAIFYGGTILETTGVENFAKGAEYLEHPYSKALWNALPQNNFEAMDMRQISRTCKEQGFIFPDRDNVMEG